MRGLLAPLAVDRGDVHSTMSRVGERDRGKSHADGILSWVSM